MMKTLKNIQTTVSGGKVTITADIVETDGSEHRFPGRQTTELIICKENPAWPRHVQISNKAVFVKAFSNAMAILNEDLVKIASVVEPKTTYPPMFRNKSDGLTVDLCSELNPDLQWQVSDSIDKNANWADIPGETKGLLSPNAAKKGQFVRLRASSEAGSMISTPALIK